MGGLAGQHWPTTPHVRPLVAAVARARGSRHRDEEPADSEAEPGAYSQGSARMVKSFIPGLKMMV